MSPYSTHHLWPPETLAAYQDMPHTASGHTAPATEEYRAAWQAWFRRTPKALWHPAVIEAYKALDWKSERRTDHGNQ